MSLSMFSRVAASTAVAGKALLSSCSRIASFQQGRALSTLTSKYPSTGVLGLMQDDEPLLVSSILDHCETEFGDSKVVTRTVEGPIVTHTYADVSRRAKQMAQALGRLGVVPGDRIGTIAWNTHRHLELYYAISGAGAVLHTINPRLFPGQIEYIVNHAENKYVFVDLTFMPLVELLGSKMPSVKAFVVMTDREHMPESKMDNLICYEDLIDGEDGAYEWPKFDERSACALCYTSGTTGNPKGVLSSHRSTVLHTYAGALPDSLAISHRDVVLPVVPMFHAQSWGLAYVVPMVGGDLVLPGAGMDGKSVWELLDEYKVTFAAGVPTVWLMLLQYLAESGKALPHLERTLIGGSAVPEAMIRKFIDNYNVHVLHGYGMTETSPLVSLCTPKRHMLDYDKEQRIAVQKKQGRSSFGVSMQLFDDEGNPIARDGETTGHLHVRGQWVTSQYYKADSGSLTADGWFPTGDVGSIDEHGYLKIADRSKDVIKSGGEWISSVDLENAALGCSGVAEAAVIGVAHPKWDERPLLIIVRSPGSEVTPEEIMSHLESQVAKWWLPDDVVFVDEIPHTATGKILKTALRDQFANHKLPTV